MKNFNALHLCSLLLVLRTKSSTSVESHFPSASVAKDSPGQLKPTEKKHPIKQMQLKLFESIYHCKVKLFFKNIFTVNS